MLKMGGKWKECIGDIEFAEEGKGIRRRVSRIGPRVNGLFWRVVRASG